MNKELVATAVLVPEGREMNMQRVVRKALETEILVQNAGFLRENSRWQELQGHEMSCPRFRWQLLFQKSL